MCDPSPPPGGPAWARTPTSAARGVADLHRGADRVAGQGGALVKHGLRVQPTKKGSLCSDCCQRWERAIELRFNPPARGGVLGLLEKVTASLAGT